MDGKSSSSRTKRKVYIMQTIPKNILLEFNDDALFEVRKMFSLEGEGRMNEAIDILQQWINKQPHFMKKDFSRQCLELTLLMCKGLVERAKAKLDKYCTYRTMMPKYYETFDPRNDVNDTMNSFKCSIMPKQTTDYYRVVIWNAYSNPKLCSATCMDFIKYLNMVLEYLKIHDYSAGVILIIDYTKVNLAELLTIVNLVELSQFLAIFMGAYCLRLKGIHLISKSKAIEVVVTLIKKASSEKIGQRIQIHKSHETLHESLPKQLLPKEYGGNEKSIAEMADDLLKVTTSHDHLEYLKMMQEARTNEAFRPTDKLNDDYMGTPGTFRTMHVD